MMKSAVIRITKIEMILKSGRAKIADICLYLNTMMNMIHKDTIKKEYRTRWIVLT
jgi:hypothetical protein